jgi:hypothetical protein
LPEAELRELGDSVILDFERRIASIPQDMCAAFHQEARQLETELLLIYKTVSLCVKKEEDLNIISNRWGVMVQMCIDFGRQLSQLSKKHPQCGAEVYYDRVLDLQNKCHRLQQMHS